MSQYAGSTANTIPADLPTPPAGAVGLTRATVALGDQLLSAAIPGTKIPSSTNTPHQYPIAVTLQVEAADAANLTYVSGFDGSSAAASAINGLQVPIAPSVLRLPYKDGLSTDAGTIRLCATVAPAHLQVFFEYAHT